MGLRVLDSRDRPLAGVEVTVIPKAGRPQQPGPYLTNARGVLDLPWLPQAKDELAHLHSADRVLTYNSALGYRVQAPGYLPVVGGLSTNARSRSLKSAELATLGADLALGSFSETVVLRRPAELLGQGLKERPAEDPLVSRCLTFHQENRALTSRLGADFAWPTFSLAKGVLTLTLEWKGITWGGLKRAPLAAQVALNSGVPLMMAAGQDLLPSPGVEHLAIQFISELPPEGQAAGPSRPARVLLQAPAPDVQALAAGRISSDSFLLKFPPRLLVDPRPGG
jgi:hypothetical protein